MLIPGSLLLRSPFGSLIALLVIDSSLARYGPERKFLPNE